MIVRHACGVLALMVLTICGCSTVPKAPLQNAAAHPSFATDRKSQAEAAAAEAELAKARARAMERALQAAATAIQKMESESKKLGLLDYFRLGQPKLMALIRTVKQEIGAVDTTGCPQEFRDAYLDFTHRFNDGWEAMDPYLGWRGQKMGLLMPWKILEVDEKTDQAMRPMNAAWQRLERIAVAGGATLPK
ncbi:MAG: hypothetical protein EB034_12460 [Verrucomicrobia bacterium]|nr:hypothetical protein [Verrucomicrobiota bacterium]